MIQTPLIRNAAGTPQSPTLVILNGARVSRSEVLAQSKDPYDHLPTHDCAEVFSLRTKLPR